MAFVSRAMTSSSFVGMTNHLDLGVGGGDHDVFAALAVGLRVDRHAQVAEVLGDGGAGGLAVLADARR